MPSLARRIFTAKSIVRHKDVPLFIIILFYRSYEPDYIYETTANGNPYVSGQTDYIHEPTGNGAYISTQPGGYIHETTGNGGYISGGQGDYIHETTAHGNTYFRSYEEPMDLMFVSNQVYLLLYLL